MQKVDKVKQEVEQQFQKELKFDGPKARKMPDFKKNDAPVKLNTAAVMREAKSIKKAKEEEGKIQTELDAVLFDTIEKFPQNIEPYLDMIEGQRMDLEKFRYKSFSELQLYCYRVAGTVGLMTQNVMGIDSAYTSAPWSNMPDSSEAAIALGIANQLTNILRDVGEDRQRGRIYLPQDDMNKFNYSEEELLKGVINNQWKMLMNFQLIRARDWFKKSEDGIKWLSADARWPVWTSLRLYRGILDSIERLDYDVFNNRAFVKNSVKAFEIPISYLISRIK